MIRGRIIETFNTHSIAPDVVVAIATGRDIEKRELMEAIRASAKHPEKTPQHLIVYGERGSGKSFLMRMIEIEANDLVVAEGLPIACALLPEEQYNIRSGHQILETVAAKVRGADWSELAYTMDFRPAAEAWDEAVEALHAALDERFGAGRGLTVAMIENFDVLSKELFGHALVESQPRGGKGLSASTVERRASEERLRKLMSRRGGRFMLIATATGTVELDYERPLFLAFKPVDLSIWSSDSCIEYFNRRRAVDNKPALTFLEEARGRAIAEFIGGNPRLAQLLADVLDSPDARTIAQTLDQLSDHLAEYYRRRIEDLPPNSRGVLDALIRKGEPCSQSKLAERVGARQNQIADAFRYLVAARLLSAEAERGGAGTLYRVRDRLFVHFYRRRYGEPGQVDGLAPIAELLERFFTAREREEQVRLHLERGEFAEARVYHGTLMRMTGVGCQSFCAYRDRLAEGAPGKLFDIAGLARDEIERAQSELRERPDSAVKYWNDIAGSAEALLQRTAALLLKAVALSRYDMDEEAWRTLEEALRIAEKDEATDARIIVLDQMAIFLWNRLKDERRCLEVCGSFADLTDRASSTYAKGCAYEQSAFYEWHQKRYQQAVEDAETAVGLAVGSDDLPLHCRALKAKAFGLQGLGQHAEVIRLCEEVTRLARLAGDTAREAELSGLKASSLGALGRHEEAISVADEAAKLAQLAGNVGEQAGCLRNKAWNLGELGKHEEAISAAEEAAKLAQLAGNVGEQAVCLRNKAWSLGARGRHEEAISVADEAAKLAQLAGDVGKQAECLSIKAFSLGALGRHEEAISVVDEAAKLAQLAGNVGEQAECLRIKAFSLGELGRHEDALLFYNQAIALAKDSNDAFTASEASRLKSYLLEKRGHLPEALEVSRDAIVAGKAGDLTAQWNAAIQAFFSIAAQTPAQDVVERMEEWLKSESAADTTLGLYLDDAAAAVARAEKWAELRSCVHEYEQSFANLKPWRVFGKVGGVWTAQAETRGRARAFASLVRDLPVIAEIMERIPLSSKPPGDRLKGHLGDLVAGLVSTCSDAGLLLDLSQLIVDVFGSNAESEAERLRSFADLHAAEDKEKVLQKFDPDLATAIRRMWDLPEPEDVLAKRGRRRGR